MLPSPHRMLHWRSGSATACQAGGRRFKPGMERRAARLRWIGGVLEPPGSLTGRGLMGRRLIWDQEKAGSIPAVPTAGGGAWPELAGPRPSMQLTQIAASSSLERGDRSSAVERSDVAREVAGSIPVGHPRRLSSVEERLRHEQLVGGEIPSSRTIQVDM